MKILKWIAAFAAFAAIYILMNVISKAILTFIPAIFTTKALPLIIRCIIIELPASFMATTCALIFAALIAPCEDNRATQIFSICFLLLLIASAITAIVKEFNEWGLFISALVGNIAAIVICLQTVETR